MDHKTTSIHISTATIINFFLVGLVIVLLFFLRDLLLVILTSIVIASFIGVVYKHFQKYNINRVLFVVFMYLLVLSIVAFIFYFFAPIISEEISNLMPIISKYLPNASLLNSFSHDFLNSKGLIANLSTSTITKEFLSGLGVGASGGTFQSVSSFFGGILNLIIIVVISFYLSIQENGIEKFLRIVIPLKHEEYAIDLWNRTQRKIALWIKGQLLLGVLVGVLTYLGLAILGVKYALLLAITAAILELVPFGIILAGIPAVLLAFGQSGFTLAVMVTGLYTIIHQFEIYLIQPLVVKKVVGISPLIVIIALLAGIKLAGIWGIILSVPVAVALLEFADDLEKKKVSARSLIESK